MTVDSDLLLLIKSSSLGDGEPDLGEKLMQAFLMTLLEKGDLPARIIFMNSGVFLTTEGSSIVAILQEFEAGGSELLSCGTCLEYYKRKDKLTIGKPTNMAETVDAMLRFPKVLSP